MRGESHRTTKPKNQQTTRQPTNKTKTGGHPTTQKAAHKGRRRQPQKRRQNNHRPKKTNRSHSKKRNQDNNNHTENKESTAKNQPKQGPGGGEGPRQSEQKRPHKSNSKWEQVTKRCQGQSGTGGRNNEEENTNGRS